jgi:hypothetical protein
MLKLTRYLYVSDEIIYTLLSNLINKESDFKEIIYWICELNHSGFIDELKNTAYYYYYNFCAINYPKYEKKINALLKKNSLISIINVYFILHTSRVNCKVFKKHIMAPKRINRFYLIKKNSFVKTLNIDKSFYKFIVSLHKKNFTNIMYYLNNNTFDCFKLYDAIKEYYTKIKQYKLASMDLSKINYTNKNHIILALILYLEEDIGNIEKRRIFKKFDKELYNNIIKEFETPKTNNYKTLKSKILYQINPTIGCFNLERFKVNDLLNKVRGNWLYYCKNSKIWDDRLKKLKISYDDGNGNVHFKNEEEEELFNETYELEFDEQSSIIQESIIPTIEKIDYDQWLRTNIKN